MALAGDDTLTKVSTDGMFNPFYYYYYYYSYNSI